MGGAEWGMGWWGGGERASDGQVVTMANMRTRCAAVKYGPVSVHVSSAQGRCERAGHKTTLRRACWACLRACGLAVCLAVAKQHSAQEPYPVPRTGGYGSVVARQ